TVMKAPTLASRRSMRSRTARVSSTGERRRVRSSEAASVTLRYVRSSAFAPAVLRRDRSGEGRRGAGCRANAGAAVCPTPAATDAARKSRLEISITPHMSFRPSGLLENNDGRRLRLERQLDAPDRIDRGQVAFVCRKVALDALVREIQSG